MPLTPTSTSATVDSMSDRTDNRLLQLPFGDHRELNIKDVLENEICGILDKWVNFGKGWRPRLFVLRDGVLSYYRIQGRREIVLNAQMDKGTRFIGEESLRRISRNKNPSSPFLHKPDGEVHLKVSSIHENRSDNKRFSIFTGTKRLHIRAYTHQDQIVWLETLGAVKGIFPRVPNSELIAPLDKITVSTDQLRLRLSEEGVSEVAIQDCEQIMKNEFKALQNQLMLVKRKYWLLIDTLQQLEVHLVNSTNHQPHRIQNSSLVSPWSSV